MRKLLLFVILLSSVFAQDIDIKGLKIGMTYQEASKLFKLGEYKKIVFATQKNGQTPTFAGVSVDYIALHFENKKINSISVKFNSSDYNQVIEPLREKYKNMICDVSVVQNRMGAKFNQEECYVANDVIGMSINKYSDNISESYISVYKKATKEEIENNKEKVKKDI